MTKFENELLLQLLLMKAEELENISKIEEDTEKDKYIYVDDGMMFKISKPALQDFSKQIKDLRSEIFFVNTKLE